MSKCKYYREVYDTDTDGEEIWLGECKCDGNLPGWIDVRDQMPENTVEVLAYGHGYYFHVALVGLNFFTPGGDVIGGITHWQPLPSPPITEKEGD